MSGLGLTPNAIVGWRIKPDWYNFTVVVVKRHGAGSAKAGQDYEEALAYCKSIEHAAAWLVDHLTRTESEHLQASAFAATQSVADVQALRTAIELAKAATLVAVAELTQKLADAGLGTSKAVVHFLHPDAALPDGT